ncbi:sugar transferase [Thermotoga profunda]|uniref:sugar transferase n=1 Tax=Thermotoga profunda TaxID=1508420 RepID=UPI0005970E4A|nr:sugar transferase [Thermotoga profunda]
MKTMRLFLLDYAILWFLNWLLTKAVFTSLVFASISCTSLFAFRVYETEHLESINEQIVRTFIALIFSNAVKYIFYPVFKKSLTFDYIYIHIFLGTISVVLANWLFNSVFKTRIKPKKYIVIGREKEIGHILDEITRKTRGEYQFVQYINPSPTTLKEKIKTYDHVLVANYELYKHVDYLLENSTAKIEYLSELAERVLRRIPLEVIENFKEYYELEFQKAKESPMKRIIDILGGIVGLIISLPIMLFFGIWILIEDGWPVFFKHLRVGKNGRYFQFVKLRSLKQEGFDPSNPNGTIQTRMLKIGKIIRPLRIDELPQFWLVLKGEMSLVGPRPEMVEYHRVYSNRIPYYQYRLRLKPGITGWAQINYQHTTTLEEYKKKTEYDLYYIKNRSTIMDLRIILQTIEAIFWRRGAR